MPNDIAAAPTASPGRPHPPPPPGPTRCCSPGTRRTACRRSRRCSRRISSRRSTPRWQAHRAELDAIAANPDAAGLRQHAGRLRPQRPRCSPASSALFHNLAVGRDLARAAGGRARDGAAAGRARQRDLHARRAVRAHRRAARAARRARRSTPEQQRLLERLHLDFVRAGARLAPAAQQRYAADRCERLAELTTQLRPERAGRRGRLPAGAARRGRPRRPAGVRARRGARRRRSSAGCRDACVDHAVALARSCRSSPSPSGATCASRPGAPGRRAASTRARTTTARSSREILRAAPRAGAPARLRQLRRLRAGRHAWRGTPARGERPARRRCGRRPRRARRPSARRSQALARARGEARADRAPGTGATGPRRCARRATTSTRPRSSRTSRSTRMVAAAFDCAAAPVRRCASSRSPTCAPTTPTCEVYEVRDARRRARRRVPARQLRAAQQAQRRVDERATACSRATRGGGVLPIIVNNNNFAKGAPGEPTLLSFDDARTLFHEFGHGLHGLLSDVTLPAPVRHQRAARFRRAALAAVRALAARAGGAARHARHHRDRRADSRRADRASCRRRASSTRASRRCATPRRRWSTWPRTR